MNKINEVAITYTMTEEFIKKNTEPYSHVDAVVVVEVNKLISIIGLFTKDNKKFYDVNNNLILIDGGGRIIATEDDDLYKSSFVKDVYSEHDNVLIEDLTITNVINNIDINKDNNKQDISKPGNKEIIEDKKSPQEIVIKPDNQKIFTEEQKLNKTDVSKIKPNKNLYIDSDVSIEIFDSSRDTVVYETLFAPAAYFKELRLTEITDGYRLTIRTNNSSNSNINITSNTTVYINGKIVSNSNKYPDAKVKVYVNKEIFKYIDITSVSSDINVKSRIEDIKAKTVSGNIKVYEGKNRVHCESVSGDIKVINTPTKQADIYTKSVSGNIEIVPKNTKKVELNTKTISGKIINTFKESGRVTCNISAQSVSGNIIIKNLI